MQTVKNLRRALASMVSPMRFRRAWRVVNRRAGAGKIILQRRLRVVGGQRPLDGDVLNNALYFGPGFRLRLPGGDRRGVNDGACPCLAPCLAEKPPVTAVLALAQSRGRRRPVARRDMDRRRNHPMRDNWRQRPRPRSGPGDVRRDVTRGLAAMMGKPGREGGGRQQKGEGAGERRT